MFKLKDIIYGMILSIVIMLFAFFGYYMLPSLSVNLTILYFGIMLLVSWGSFYLFLDLANPINNIKDRNCN